MILSTLETRYSLENPNVPIAEGFTLLNLFGGKNSITGKTIGTEDALSYSPVWAAISIIAGHVGAMPLKLYKRRTDGGKDEERSHWVWNFCRVGPNRYMAAGDYQEHAQGHVLLKGNAYTELQRDGSGQVVAAKLLHPERVELRQRGSEYFWSVEEDGRKRPVLWDDMLHVAGLGGNGITGWSVIRYAMESIAQGLSAEEYGGRYYANSARPSGFLSVPEIMKKEAQERLKESWHRAQGGLENAHKVAVLEGGITWQQMGLTAEESQFLETREHLVRDVARWFNLPIHLLGDRSTSGYNSLTEENMRFLSGTLQRWLVKWESAIAARLLTDREREAGLFVEFVREGLLQLDPGARGEFYAKQFQVGAITPNEIRLRENRNPIEGGDKAYIQVNMIPLDQFNALDTDDQLRLIRAAHGHAEPAKDETRAVERRNYHDRYVLRERFRPAFREAADRLVRGEIRDITRKLSLLDEPVRWIDFLEDYYFNAFPEFAWRTMGAIMDAYGQVVAGAAAREIGLPEPLNDVGKGLSMYTEGFVRRYAGSSRRQLTNLAKQDEPRVAVEERLHQWDDDKDSAPRSEKVANNEIVQESESISKAVWVAGGILTLRWLAVGDSCPYCEAMNGRVVGVQQDFVSAKDAVVAADGNLVPSVSIPHPPLHRGCDCVIVPG